MCAIFSIYRVIIKFTKNAPDKKCEVLFLKEKLKVKVRLLRVLIRGCPLGDDHEDLISVHKKWAEILNQHHLVALKILIVCLMNFDKPQYQVAVIELSRREK